jgi:excisionase family DNA binding protein
MQSKPTTSKTRPRFLHAGSRALDCDPLTLEDGLLTAYEVARMLHISRSNVYRLMKSGDLPSFKVGFVRRFRRDDVQSYMDRRAGPIRRWTRRLASHRRKT